MTSISKGKKHLSHPDRMGGLFSEAREFLSELGSLRKWRFLLSNGHPHLFHMLVSAGVKLALVCIYYVLSLI